MQLQVQLEEHSYPIYIEHHALDRIKNYLDPNRKYAIVTDDGLQKKWVDKLQAQLPNAFVICFPHGEANKNLETYQTVMKKLIEHHMSRSDALIALGGGVVGDLGGFVASTYMRGIDFYNIPTTVLSQVDSSVGGKVAVDFDTYKNIIGAFYQPKAVIIDPETLTTLDPRQISNGLVEALKMGLILDERLVQEFEKDTLDLDTIIAASIDLKRQIVQDDEKEQGKRAILNFGHTIGHALESRYFDVPYYHGECIGMGMLFFLNDPALKHRVEAILEKLNIPSIPDYDPEEILSYVKHDKKGKSETINIIEVPKAGSWQMKTITYPEIRQILQGGIHEK